MSASVRPTREQVDAALAMCGTPESGNHPAAFYAYTLAAEVRALRAELVRTLDRLVTALAARTPQPADPADTAQVGDRLGKAWVDAQQAADDGGCRAVAAGGVWMCTRSAHTAGTQHVATLGGRVVVAWIEATPSAVPDEPSECGGCESSICPDCRPATAPGTPLTPLQNAAERPAGVWGTSDRPRPTESVRGRT